MAEKHEIASPWAFSLASSDSFDAAAMSDFELDPLSRFNALPGNEQQILEAVKGIETKQQSLLYEYQLELLALKNKYVSLLDPLYNRRKALLAGGEEPETAELDAGEQALQKVLGPEFKAPSRLPLHSDGIANFWLAIFMNHPGLSMIIAERDQKALEHLTDIRCTYFGVKSAALGKSGGRSYASAAAGHGTLATVTTVSPISGAEPFGFKLSFYFSRNEYFSDEVLEKTYYYKHGEVNESGELLYEKSVGCSISWKSGKDLTVLEEDEPSFFTFFNPKTLPSKAEVDAMSDEDYGALLDDIDGDFDCGEDIRDEIIPFALNYLIDPPMGEGEEEEDDSDEEDDDDT